MRVIGLTGGLASGKSAVARALREWGFPVIDADQIARDVVAPESPVLQEVVDALGPEVRNANGTLNRRYLRDRVAKDLKTQETLNAILHPRIRKAIEDALDVLRNQGHSHAFVEAALILEAGAVDAYDAIILVTAPRSLRIQRAARRDNAMPEAAEALMARQSRDEDKRTIADVEIVNDGSLDQLGQRTRSALANLGIQVSG